MGTANAAAPDMSQPRVPERPRSALELRAGLSERLRIAYVTDTIGGRLGGGVVAARNVVSQLRTHHDVVVAAADASGFGDVRLPGFVLPVRAMRDMQFTMARPDRGALSRALEGVDVAHLQFPFWLSMVAVREARRLGVPVVAAFHVQPENALYNVGIRWKWLARAIYRFWVDRVFNRADAVVCPTEFARRKLIEHGLVRPAYVISNGVPPDVSRLDAPREPAHVGRVVVLSVGRLAAEKRQDVLIEAVHQSAYRDRIALVLAGAGPREAKLRRLAADLHVDAEIGFLPRERLLRLLGTADLMVHPGEVELEGIAVLEAMRAGLPAIVAESPESAASGLALGSDLSFPAGDATILARRIDALVAHPLRREHARVRAVAASRAYSFEASVASLEQVYRGVVRRRAATAR